MYLFNVRFRNLSNSFFFNPRARASDGKDIIMNNVVKGVLIMIREKFVFNNGVRLRRK